MSASDPSPTSGLEAEVSPLASGQELAGRYRIVRLLGRGGMGAVYEARHIALGRAVAIKVLLRELTADSDAVARFMQEARAAAAIGHPGIVEVFDLGEDQGMTFLAMQLLDGEELASRLEGGRKLPPGDVARIGSDLADAVAAAHEAGIIHRDLKPQNIFLAREGRRVDVVKVLDFGLAKLAVQDRVDGPQTLSGVIFGTPLYMSPEQLLSSKGLDGRSDIYTIGAILYEALAGRAPYEAETYGELVLTVSTEPPPPLSRERPDAPPELVAVIERAMAKDKEARFQSARELGDALEEVATSLGAVTTTSSGTRRVTASSAPSGPTPAWVSGPASGGRGGSTAAGPAATPFATERDSATAPRSSRGPLLAVAAVAVVLLVAAGALLALLGPTRGGRGDAPPGETPGQAERLRSPPPEGAGPPPSGARRQSPDAAADGSVAAPHDEPAAPAMVTVEIVTAPAGAAVSVGDGQECTSPCRVSLAATAEALVGARLAGYRDAEQRLTPPLPSRVEIRLRKRGPSAGVETGHGEPPPLLPR